MRNGLEDVLGRTRDVHFVGIGGIGMSGLAELLASLGYRVSGSDATASDLTRRLEGMGVRVFEGHAAGHLGDADAVVVSSAVGADNPEVLAARERGIPVVPRGELLAELMRTRHGIAIGGAHGKTTTTSMVAFVLQQAGLDPTAVIGGRLRAFGSNARLGQSRYFVAEADESDGSFLMLAPEVAVVTNVEADHLDNYGGFEKVKENFARFVDRIEPGGTLVAGADDPVAVELADRARARGLAVRTYGEAEGADLRVTGFTPRGLGSRFRIGGFGEVELNVPGRHNALNAAAVVAVAQALGHDDEPVRAGLAAFGGAMRRLERKGEAGGVEVFDSYAHHPTELTADLDAARDYLGQKEGGGRIVAVFQPHLYSRTRFFAAEFGAALGLADVAVVMDVYGAREDPEPGVTGALVADAVPAGVETVYAPVRDEVPGIAVSLARPGDVVITLGAGDVTGLGPLILERLAG